MTHDVSYLTTIKDAAGNFASRAVITLHGDHAMSVIDSRQEGPAFHFGSQLGSWKENKDGEIAAKTIDFNFPSAGISRVDYTISFVHNGAQLKGAITVTNFPLEGNPLHGGGTHIGNFTFLGDSIKP